MTAGATTYHQQISYCGKQRCRKCREGVGHGPYWYAYRTENGRTTRTYIGKNPPPEALITADGAEEYTPAQVPGELALRVYTLLGKFRVERRNERAWQEVGDAAWKRQHVRSLFVHLLISPGRMLGREQLMDALWPELDVETAASRLDRTVHSLRQILEPHLSRLADSHLLRTERESLILADQAYIWLDADAFEQLLTKAHATSDPAEREKFLEEGGTLYGDILLREEGDADWVTARRERLHRSWLGSLLELADLRIARSAFASVIEPLDRLLALDSTNEAAVQRLMISLTHLDRRAEAMRAYQRFANELQRRYKIPPLEETRSLYEATQQGTVEITSVLQLRSQVTQMDESSERLHRPALGYIGRSHQGPLIGRESELATLQHLLEASEQHTRAQAAGRKRTVAPTPDAHWQQCVMLVGEAGIGKTRLAEELARVAQRHGWVVAWSRVYAQESSVPYRQWTEVLRNAMSRGLWQRQDLKHSGRTLQPLSMLLPELQPLLPPDTAFPPPLSPGDEQRRLWEATLELLTMISERTPLVIVLDDLHWADASSCELLAFLARRLHRQPIMIMGTYRDTELPAQHPLRTLFSDLQREQVSLSMQIQPLTSEQIASLVSHLPQPVVQHIQTRAAGNPFFAEELARGLEAGPTPNGHGLPAPTPTRAEPGDTAQQPLPDTIAAVLNLRMSRLSSACQRLLGNAAVLGGSFDFNVLLQMESSGGGTSEDTVLDLLEEALKEGVLTEEGAGTRITYHFW
ncbi:MAG: AAA family ATPase, partial [Ktedonobacteraceae bacterium]